MQNLIKHTLYLFLYITAATAIITLVGIGYVWFFSGSNGLPYLNWLIGSVVAEMVFVIIMLAKRGMKYLPDTQIDKKPTDTIKFMEKFISIVTSVTIVSNRVSWLAGNDKLIAILQSKIKDNAYIEIITPNEVTGELKEKLTGAVFIFTKEETSPESRFTLVNGNRSGAERLAIARGVHPNHEITIFDNNSGPQIIAMAKDIIRKSKSLSNAQ